MNTNSNGGTNSQTKQILEHMKQGNRITALEALTNFGCFRLAARINDLKKNGIPVSKEMVDRNGKKVAEYYFTTGKSKKRTSLRTV